MPRTKEQNELIRLKRIKQIIDAGMNIYFNQGVRGFEMQAVAKEAELGKGTVYHYYNNKEELLREIFKLIVKDAQKVVDELLLSDEEPIKRLENFFRYQIKLTAEKPFIYRFYKNMMEDIFLVFPPEEADCFISNIGTKLNDPIIQTIQEAIDKAQIIKMNPWRLGQIFWGALVGAATIYVNPEEIKKDSSMLDDIINILFNGIKK